MADDRKRLIDLISTAPVWKTATPDEAIAQLAEHLLANGVTVPVRCENCKFWVDDGTEEFGSCAMMESRYTEDCESNFDSCTRFDSFCSDGEVKCNE